MNNELVERVAEIIKANTRMVRGCEVKGDCPHCARDIKEASAAVLAELAGEMEDKARVDWMAKQKSIAVHCRKGMFAINPSINYEYELKPLREAIDEARHG